MKFRKVDVEYINNLKIKKVYNKTMKKELMEFVNSGWKYALVSDTHYNNNNDLRRAIQQCIEMNNLPIAVFMSSGSTFLMRL